MECPVWKACDPVNGILMGTAAIAAGMTNIIENSTDRVDRNGDRIDDSRWRMPEQEKKKKQSII